MKTPEQIIEEFQNACLARVQEIHETAQVELDRSSAELTNVRREAETLRGALAFAQSEIALVLKQRDERDARISGLLALVEQRDHAIAANDRGEPALISVDALRELHERLEAAEAARDEAQSECEDSDKEIDKLREEVTDLEKQLEELSPPEPLVIAAAAHDYLRDSRLLPAHLDAPLRLAPHDYLMGLTGAIGAELPQ
jgi:chromosome segregation ATPase